MKTMLLACFCMLFSHTAVPPMASAVFSWSAAKATPSATGQSRQLVNGTTTDLEAFNVHTSTLEAGKTNHPFVAHDDREELIVVKEGRLTMAVGDSVKTVGPGGLALIVAGDRQSFQNDTKGPVTYYVLSYQSRNAVSIARGREGGGSLIRDWSEYPVKKTEKGESRPVFDRPSSMFERFDVHATNLDPGFASHDPHRHRAEEVILLLKGDVQMQLNDTFHKATAGDLVFLASQDLHALKNTGTVQCSYYAIQWHNKKDD